jgi:hypothetical protein
MESKILFPTIALLARDIFAIPVTSVSVKRAFSKSCHICSDLYSSLKAENIIKALLPKVWIYSGLFELNELKVLCQKHGNMMDVNDS